MDEKDNFQTEFWIESGGDSSPNLDFYFSDGVNADFCVHEWANYEGFTDAFEYCVKCDVKNR
jgi:hypothetical protein